MDKKQKRQTDGPTNTVSFTVKCTSLKTISCAKVFARSAKDGKEDLKYELPRNWKSGWQRVDISLVYYEDFYLILEGAVYYAVIYYFHCELKADMFSAIS